MDLAKNEPLRLKTDPQTAEKQPIQKLQEIWNTLNVCSTSNLIYLIYFLFQPVINSTVTANMTFTKTSQKFGQWSDVRANTVYGLGFSAEAELNKVTQHFFLVSRNFSPQKKVICDGS